MKAISRYELTGVYELQPLAATTDNRRRQKYSKKLQVMREIETEGNDRERGESRSGFLINLSLSLFSSPLCCVCVNFQLFKIHNSEASKRVGNSCPELSHCPVSKISYCFNRRDNISLKIPVQHLLTI